MPDPARARPATLSIVHPWDPWAQGIGGFDTCIDGVRRAAPSHWEIELIGVTADAAQRPVGQWLTIPLDGRPVRFFAVLHDPKPDNVRAIPLSLRFAAASLLRRVSPSGAIVQFHRFESSHGVALSQSQRTVFFLHNHPEAVRSDYSDDRWRWTYSVFRYLLRARLAKASAVVCVDPRTPEWVRAQVPSLDGSVFHQQQWADPELFDPGTSQQRERDRKALRHELGLRSETRIAIYAGRLERQKDPLLLLEAFAELASGRHDVALLVVGKGTFEQMIVAKAARLGLGRRFHLMPPVPRGDLAPLYRGSDVAVCTSGFEAGPRHVFEALACGLPVVSSDVGQVREVLGRNGNLGQVVGERTPAAFAVALDDVLSEPPSPQLASRRREAVRDFTPERALSPIFSLYREWLAES
jgi:glycosyltransferase involved in cell wall biosynthesis